MLDSYQCNMIPKKVLIGGHTITIKYKKVLRHGGSELLGLCDADNLTIWLKKGMNPDRKKEVFLHESVHMISDIHGLRLNEKQVNCLGVCIFSLIVNNGIELLN